MPERLPNYGGQALIEGVLMRGRKTAAIALRTPDGHITVHTEPLTGIYQTTLMRIPFLRGLVGLWDGLILGIRALTLSANQQTGENEKIEGPTLYLTLGSSLALAVAVFFLAPAGIGQLAEKYLGWNSWWSNFFEGVLRLALLIGYIWGVGKIPDIERVFAYHGAEHKTINAFEGHAQMTVDEVSRFSVEHPRCGTAFLLTLALVSILVFSALGPLSIFWRLATRIMLIPVLAGVAYEYIRWTANHMTSPVVRWLVRPNLAMQNLTTREPTPDMLEVSISAFNAMLEAETSP